MSSGLPNDVRIGTFLDTTKLAPKMRAELQKLASLERHVIRTGEPAVGQPSMKAPRETSTGRFRDPKTGRFVKEPADMPVGPLRGIGVKEVSRELEANMRERGRIEKEHSRARNKLEKDILRKREIEGRELGREVEANIKERSGIEKDIRRQRGVERRDIGREVEANIKQSEQARKQRVREFLNVTKMEDRMDASAAKSRRDVEKARQTRDMQMSRQMMGFAGVGTALSMPISGFTPLTIGFASMSGTGFGVAAAGAVMIRALFDITKGLNKLQDSFAEAAISSNAVSDGFKLQKNTFEAIKTAQGFLVTEQRTDRLKKWNSILEDSTRSIIGFNEAWGQLRSDLVSIPQSLIGGAEGKKAARGIGAGIPLLFGGGLTGLIGSLLGGDYGESLYNRGQKALAERGPAIDEAIRNLDKTKFQSRIVSPENFYSGLATKGLSSGLDNKELIELQKKMLEELKEQSRIAREELAGKDSSPMVHR